MPIPAPIPDRPEPFGYKQIWLAVKGVEPSEVASALGLEWCQSANWAQGIDRAYRSYFDSKRGWYNSRVEIFVAPPVRGWTLAVGGIGALPAIESSEWIPWLEGLSERLGHVQFFGTHRVSNCAAWAKAENGRILRAFAYADGRFFEAGPRTTEEIELGFDFLDVSRATPEQIAAHGAKREAEFLREREIAAELQRIRDGASSNSEELDRAVYDESQFGSRLELLDPDEDSVMMIAGCWSLDPTRLDEIETEPGLGLLGTFRMRR